MKERYLDDFYKPLVERRSMGDRRKVHTVLDPSMERRKVLRRKKINKHMSKAEMIKAKKKRIKKIEERKNWFYAILFGAGAIGILMYCFLR